MPKKHEVSLIDGAGGQAMGEFLNRYILKHMGFKNTFESKDILLEELDDASTFSNYAFTTDIYTVRPIFFPGGDIGRLAISGTINDLAMVGADPIALSLSLLIEAGFHTDDLEKIMVSAANTCKEANVPVITGDTKVVEGGSIDGVYINTAGVGLASKALEKNYSVLKEFDRKLNGLWLRDKNIRDGDVIIASGYIGDHGIAVLSAREGYGFETDIKSDVKPLNHMMNSALKTGGIVAAKDPTRGGVANLLNEWRIKANVGIKIYEEYIPIKDEVKAASELLGIDPLTIGNEGKAIIAVHKDMAEDVLKSIKNTPAGKDAAIIGQVTSEEKYVVLETEVGGKRILEAPIGDPVPRIC